RVANLLVQVDGALHRLVPVAEVKALVFRVGIGVRVLDADQERWYAAQLAREGLDEGDAAAAPDRHRLGPVASSQRTERRLERRAIRFGVPPSGGVVGVALHLAAPRGRLLLRVVDAPPDVFRVV